MIDIDLRMLGEGILSTVFEINKIPLYHQTLPQRAILFFSLRRILVDETIIGEPMSESTEDLLFSLLVKGITPLQAIKQLEDMIPVRDLIVKGELPLSPRKYVSARRVLKEFFLMIEQKGYRSGFTS